MLNRLYSLAPTTSVVYAVIFNSAGQYWNGSSFENYAGANWSTYAITLTESGTSGRFTASIPSGITTPAVYLYTAYRRIGGTVAVTDPPIYEGFISVGVGYPGIDASNRIQIQSGTATGQLVITSGVVNSNPVQVAGNTITRYLDARTAVPCLRIVDALGGSPVLGGAMGFHFGNLAFSYVHGLAGSDQGSVYIDSDALEPTVQIVKSANSTYAVSTGPVTGSFTGGIALAGNVTGTITATGSVVNTGALALQADLLTTKTSAATGATAALAAQTNAATANATASNAYTATASTLATISNTGSLTLATVAATGATVQTLPTAAQTADAVLDRADGVETGLTLRQAIRLMAAVLVGKVAKSGNTFTFRNATDTKARVTATTNAENERTAVTRDVS